MALELGDPRLELLNLLNWRVYLFDLIELRNQWLADYHKKGVTVAVREWNELKREFLIVFGERQRQLVELVYAVNRDDPEAWLSRAELARKLEKNRLSPHDIKQLDRLVNKRWLETRHHSSPATVVPYYHVYRVRDEIRWCVVPVGGEPARWFRESDILARRR